MTLQFEVFKSGMESWDKLFQRAADFATNLGPDRVVNISHSEDQNEGVVTVWYWDKSLSDRSMS